MHKVKLSAVKATGEGESLAAEVLVEDPLEATPGALKALMRPVLNLMDDRLLEMNKRVVAANTRTRQLDPKTQMIVHEVFELLHGRKTLEEVAKAVEAQAADDAAFASDREASK